MPRDLASHFHATEREREGGREAFEAVDARQIIFLNNTRRCFSPRITSCSSSVERIQNVLPSTPTPRSLQRRYFSQLYDETPLNIFALRISSPSPMTSGLHILATSGQRFIFQFIPHFSLSINNKIRKLFCQNSDRFCWLE